MTFRVNVMNVKLPKLDFSKKNQQVALVLVVLVVAGLLFTFLWRPPVQKTYGTEIEKQIADRIKAGTEVTSQKQATESIVAVSQELEKVSGSLSQINQNLEKKQETQPAPSTGPSGYSVLEVAGTTMFMAALVGLVFLYIASRKTK